MRTSLRRIPARRLAPATFTIRRLRARQCSGFFRKAMNARIAFERGLLLVSSATTVMGALRMQMSSARPHEDVYSPGRRDLHDAASHRTGTYYADYEVGPVRIECH